VMEVHDGRLDCGALFCNGLARNRLVGIGFRHLPLPLCRA
jgi:hypothetical protein